MSSSQLDFEIVDGENALALVSQLIDIARGHVGPRFNIKVRHKLPIGIEGQFGIEDNQIPLDLNIVGMTRTFMENWSIIGFVPDDVVAANPWLGRAINENEFLKTMRLKYPVRRLRAEGMYDTNRRSGSLSLTF